MAEIRLFCESGSPWVAEAVTALESEDHGAVVIYVDQGADKYDWQDKFNVWHASDVLQTWGRVYAVPSVSGLIGVAVTGDCSCEHFDEIVEQLKGIAQGL